MCIFQYKSKENKGICIIHLLQEHSNFRNFRNSVVSGVKSLLAQLRKEREGYVF